MKQSTYTYIYGEMYIAQTVLLDPSKYCQIQIWKFKTKITLLVYMYFQSDKIISIVATHLNVVSQIFDHNKLSSFSFSWTLFITFSTFSNDSQHLQQHKSEIKHVTNTIEQNFFKS
jgi:hypothetical protein